MSQRLQPGRDRTYEPSKNGVKLVTCCSDEKCRLRVCTLHVHLLGARSFTAGATTGGACTVRMPLQPIHAGPGTHGCSPPFVHLASLHHPLIRSPAAPRDAELSSLDALPVLLARLREKGLRTRCTRSREMGTRSSWPWPYEGLGKSC